MATIYTVGRGARSAVELIAILRDTASALAARAERSCIMCAESNPEHCHRLHIAEWLVRNGQRVVHLLAPGRSRAHARNPQEELWRDV